MKKILFTVEYQNQEGDVVYAEFFVGLMSRTTIYARDWNENTLYITVEKKETVIDTDTTSIYDDIVDTYRSLILTEEHWKDDSRSRKATIPQDIREQLDAFYKECIAKERKFF